MPEPHVVETWMRWEFSTLNAGLVIRPRPLQSLLEKEALLTTKDGEPYSIDRATLERMASACSTEERERLRLPITVHFPADSADSTYVIDALAAEVLRRLEGWGPAYPFREGKMWLPLSLAVDLLLRYGGALQQLMF